MRPGGVRSVLLDAPRSLSDLPHAPKEGIGRLEQQWLASTMPQQLFCRDKNTLLDPDFRENVRGNGGGCGLVGCVVCCWMLPEASLTCPMHPRKVLEDLNSSGWHPPCHNSSFAVTRTPSLTLIFVKMSAE